MENAWLRDNYFCEACRSIPRQRHLQHVLDTRFPGWENMEIHESSPGNDFLRRYAPNFSFSQYLPDVPWGSVSDQGVRSENLEQLTFDANSFDLFITQDVLEHVFDPARVIAEVMRVLRPGGAHVFTAPKHRGLDKTVQRARLVDNGDVVHLLEPVFHGNPVGDGTSLVTFDYGYDFEQLLSQWAGSSVSTVQTLDERRGLVAEFNEVFVIVKAGGSEWVTARHAPAADAPGGASEPAMRELVRMAAGKVKRRVRRTVAR
jgi:hypothetical protein